MSYWPFFQFAHICFRHCDSCSCNTNCFHRSPCWVCPPFRRHVQ